MPKQIKNLVNINFSNGSWPNYDEEEHKSRNKLIEKVNNILGDINESYTININNQANSNYDLARVERDIEKAFSIINGKGSLYAMDIETTGNILDDATDFEKQLFGITEISISRKSFANGASNLETVHNVLFGLTEEQFRRGEELIQKARTQPWNSLTATEKSTLERYARASVSISQNKNANGLFTVTNPGKYSKYNITAAERGLGTLRDVGRNQGIDTVLGRINLQAIQNMTVAMSSNDNQTIFHNGRVFDIPLLEKAFGFKFGENILDTFEVMKATNMDVISEIHANAPFGNTVREHMMSLTALNKAMDIDVSQAHTAAADTMNHLEVVTKKNNKGQNLIDIFKTTLTKIKSNKAITKASPLFFVDNSINYGGTALSKGDNMDYFSYMDKDEAEHIIENQEWILNKNRFYSVVGVEQLNVSEDTALAKKVSNGTLYKMRLKNAASDSNEYVTIFRENLSDFEHLFNGKITPMASVSQTAINAAERAYKEDLARREWQRFFQIGESGYMQADKFYATYRNLKKAYIGVEALDQDKILKLIEKGKLYMGAESLKYDEVFAKFANKEGVISRSQVRNFAYMFNILEDTSDTVSALLGKIGDLVPFTDTSPTANVKRTTALKVAMNIVQQKLTEKGVYKQALSLNEANVGKKTVTFGDYMSVPFINTKGDKVRLGVGNKNLIGAGIYRDLMNTTEGVHNPATRDSMMRKRAKEIINFYRKTVFGTNTDAGKALKNIDLGKEDFSALSKTIGNTIFEHYDNLINNFTADELVNMNDTIGSINSELDNLSAVIEDAKNNGTELDESFITRFNNQKQRLDQLKKIDKINKTGGELEIFNMAGVKVNGLSYDKLVSDVVGLDKNDLKSIASNGASNNLSYGTAIPFPTIKPPDGIKGDYTLDKTLESKLINELGYGVNSPELEVMRKAFDGLYDGDISISIDEVSNNDVTDMVLSFVKKSQSNELRNGMVSGEEFEKAVKIVLPRMETYNGLTLMKQGNVERINNFFYSVFFNNDNNPSVEYFRKNNLSIAEDTVASKSLNYLYIMKDTIKDAVLNGTAKDMRHVSNRVQGMINGVINKASAATGYENINNIRKLIPNARDIFEQSTADIGELSNLMPLLYQENRDFAERVDKIMIEKGGMRTPAKVSKFMDEWIRDLRSGSHGDVRKYKDLPFELQDFFVSNFTNGYRLIDKFKELTGVKSKEGNTNLINVISTGNQIIKEGAVQDGKISFANHVTANTGGIITDMNRPLVQQHLSYHSLVLENMNKDVIDRLAKSNIYIGQSIMDVNFVNNVYDKATNLAVDKGVSGFYKVMNEAEIYKAIEDTFSKQSFTNHLRKRFHYTKDDIENAKKIFYAKAGTYEQGGMLNPILGNVYQTRAIHTFSFDAINTTLDASKVAVGKKVEYNDVIGTYVKDGKTLDLRYSKKGGTITHIEGGTLQINPDDTYIDEVKGGFGGVEKSVMATFDPNAKDMQYIFNEIFGFDTVAVGNFELKKHEAGSLILQSNIDYIAQQVINSGNSAYMNDFLGLYNKHFGNLNGQYTEIYKGTPYQRTIFQIDQSKAGNLNLFEAFKSFKQEFLDKAQSNDFYKQMLPNLWQKNKIFAPTNFMQLNTEYGSEIDDESLINKGVKTTANERQVFGSSISDNIQEMRYYREFKDGKYQKIAQTFIDEDLKFAMSTEEAQSARSDLKKIQKAIGLSAGTLAEEDVKVATVDLSKVSMPKGGISAQNLADTFYGEYKDYDAVKVILPEGLEIDNFFKKITDNSGKTIGYEQTNSPYIPMLSTAKPIENQVYNTIESQKNIADLINSLQELMSPSATGRRTVDEINAHIKAVAMQMVRGYHNEFNSKNGLMSRMTTARKPFSGHELAGKVIAPLYDKYGEHLNKAFDSDLFMNINGKRYAKDIAWLSENSFLNKAGDSFFKDLGNQLQNELNYNGYEDFARKIQDEIASGKSINAAEIGRRYAEEIGIEGFMKRYPVFHAGSKKAVLFRLNRNTKSNSVIAQAHTALDLNLDIDADILGIELQLYRGADNTIKINSRYNEFSKAHQTMMEGQALLNGTYTYNEATQKGTWSGLIGEAIGNYNKQVGNAKITQEDYIDYLKSKEKGRTGFSYLEDAHLSYTAVKTRYDKLAIGYVSNPNKYLRDIGFSLFSDNFADMQKYSYLEEFTRKTEQNPIDIKHLSGEKLVSSDRIALQPQYGKAIGLMARGEIDDGMAKMLDVLRKSGFSQFDNTTVNDIANKGYKELEGLHRGLKAMYDIMSSEEGRALWHSPMLQTSGGSTDQMVEELTSIANMELDGHTGIVQEKINALNKEYDTAKGNIKAYYGNSSGMYTREKLGVGGVGINYAEFKDINSKNTFRVYGKDYNEIEKILSGRYTGYNSIKDIPVNILQTAKEANLNNKLAYESEQMQRILTTLMNHNMLQESESNRILSNYNNSIKERGLNGNIDFAKTRRNRIAETLFGRFESLSNPRARQMLLDEAANLDMNTSASTKASEIISRIDGVESYDIDAIRDKIAQKYTEEIGNLNADDNVKSLIMKSVVHGQADEYAKQNALIIQKLNSEYESLVSTNSDTANAYLGWSDANNIIDSSTGGLKLDSVSVMLNREDVLNTLGNQRIASGDFVGAKISDLSLDDLRNVIGAKGNGNAYNQTQTRVNAYLSAVDALDAESGESKEINAMLNAIHSRATNYSNFATSSIDDAVKLDDVVTQMNDAIKKAGKVLDEPVNDIVKNVSMWNNKSVKMGVGIALGLATVAGIVGSQFTSPPSALNPSKRPNGTGSPSPDGDYAGSSRPMITAAPPSERTVRMANGNGVNFRVKGTMNPNLTNRDIAEAVGRTARKQGNLNVNVTSRDQSNIDRPWLEQQVSNMI